LFVGASADESAPKDEILRYLTVGHRALLGGIKFKGKVALATEPKRVLGQRSRPLYKLAAATGIKTIETYRTDEIYFHAG